MVYADFETSQAAHAFRGIELNQPHERLTSPEEESARLKEML